MSHTNAMHTSNAAAAASVTSEQGTAQQVNCTGSFDLPCRADHAFPLFSPEGERHWVKGWDPRPVFPETIVFGRDTVFTEAHSGEEAIWTIVDVDWQTHRAEYVRFAPASHTARILVKIDSVAERATLPSRTPSPHSATNASTLLESFSESAHAARMKDWQHQIAAYLEKR